MDYGDIIIYRKKYNLWQTQFRVQEYLQHPIRCEISGVKVKPFQNYKRYNKIILMLVQSPETFMTPTVTLNQFYLILIIEFKLLNWFSIYIFLKKIELL